MTSREEKYRRLAEEAERGFSPDQIGPPKKFCTNCNGTGDDPDDTELFCPKCDGSGLEVGRG